MQTMSSRDDYIENYTPMLALILILLFFCKSVNIGLGLDDEFQVCWNDHFYEISSSRKSNVSDNDTNNFCT